MSGQVDRKINQVSTASVTLRNPGRAFTWHKSNGTKFSAAFHPQDPITIYMERISGKPVRVFTGYLDTTPYYQLYPGTITLEASCTLKRLLYSYFDPSLPYVIDFLAQYGWINAGNGSLLSSSTFDSTQISTQQDVNNGTKPFTDLQDGSLGNLLWASLWNFGQWQDANIYIEALPSGANGIAARMASLMQAMDQMQQDASAEFSTFLEAVVGAGSSGSGGGSGNPSNSSSGTVTGGGNAGTIWNFFEPKIGGFGAAGLIGNAAQESGGTHYQNIQLYSDVSQAHYGMWQMSSAFGATSQQMSTAQNQCQFLWQQLNSSYKEVLSALKNASSPTDASNSFFNDFEKAGDTTGPTRAAQAEAAYKHFNSEAQNQNSQSGTSGNNGANDQTNDQTLNQTSLSTEVVSGNSARSQQSGVSGNNGANSGKGTAPTSGNSSGGNSAGDQNGASVSRVQAMIDAAQAITNSDYPYAWGGGHPSAGTPSMGSSSESGGATVLGFDCSGSVAAVLAAASAGIPFGGAVGADSTVISDLQSKGVISPGQGKGTPEVTLWDSPGVHIFMSINGRYFGTSDGNDGNHSQKNGGAGWLNDGHADTSSFTPYHYNASYLNQTVKYQAPKVKGTDSGAGSAGSGSGSGGGTNNTSAQAFTAEIAFPGIEDMVTAVALGAEGKGLMHDQSLMPWIQQLCTASLRSFQSLPNGDFYAFYPDYFGEMGTSEPYWVIDDIEVLDGGINLTDESLATHVYAIGDNSWPVNNELVNELFSAGTISVYNAFLGNLIVDTKNSQGASPSSVKNKSGQNKQGSAQSNATTEVGADLSGDIMDSEQAGAFIQRYGARPLVQNYPMVRSAIYEMLLAYQQFMMAWSSQFQTPFAFTFMPEIFPGGKVAFQQHGLQMYVEEVVHEWDYAEAGFTTTATLSAPARWGKTNNDDLPPYMVRGPVEPVQNATAASVAKTAQSVVNAAGNVGKSISAGVTF